MDKEYNGYTFANFERFEKFLEDNYNNEIINIDLFLDELLTQLDNSGMTIYELSKHETKSKNAECISYGYAAPLQLIIF